MNNTTTYILSCMISQLRNHATEKREEGGSRTTYSSDYSEYTPTKICITIKKEDDMKNLRVFVYLFIIILIFPVLLGLYAESNEIPQTWINKVIENIKQKDNTSILQHKDNRPAVKAINVISEPPDWMGESNQVDAEYSMWAVSTAGDVNNDGYDDVIISAPNYDNGELDEGAAFMYYGNSNGVLIEGLSITGYAYDGYIELKWHGTSPEYQYKIYKKKDKAYQLLCTTKETKYIDKDISIGKNEYKIVVFDADNRICEHTIDVFYINSKITQIKEKIYFDMNYINKLINISEITIYSITGRKINEVKATGEYILIDKDRNRQKIIVIK